MVKVASVETHVLVENYFGDVNPYRFSNGCYHNYCSKFIAVEVS